MACKYTPEEVINSLKKCSGQNCSAKCIVANQRNLDGGACIKALQSIAAETIETLIERMKDEGLI